MKNNRKTTEIILEYNDRDVWTICAASKMLQNRINKGKPVPAWFLKEYFALFTNKGSRLSEEITSRNTEIIENIKRELSKDNEFDFKKSVKEKIIGLKHFANPYLSLENLLNYIHIYHNATRLPNKKKEKVKYFHNIIENYFASYNIPEHRELFSKYKRDVLIGYLLIFSGETIQKGMDLEALKKRSINRHDISEALKKYTAEFNRSTVKEENYNFPPQFGGPFKQFDP